MKLVIAGYEAELVWNGQTPYNLWTRAQHSGFGEYAWGVTNVRTGKGGGGFAETRQEAKEKARKFIEEQN